MANFELFFATDDDGSAKSSDVTEVKSEKKKSTFVSDLFEWLDVFVKAIIVVVILFTAVFKIATIDGDSMQNTVFEGEKVIISNIFNSPKQGDIVVVSRNYKNSADCYERNSAPIIKRVIATEGQTVDINFDKGEVIVDGVVLDEPYIKNLTTNFQGTEFPLLVEDGCVFVLGDNRKNSKDSRAPVIGLIDEREILGKAIFLFFPGTDQGNVDRDFSRIGALP